MITIPFIYFTGLFFHIFKRNKFKLDIACYILLIYDISALFGIAFDLLGLRPIDIQNYKISFTATITYCSLLTLCLLPFIKYSNLQIIKIYPLSNKGLILKFIAIGSFVFFIIAIFFSWGDLIQSLTSDTGQLRQEHYLGLTGSGIWFAKFPSGIKELCVMLNLMMSVPWIMHFLAFYSLCIQKIKKTYVAFLFIGSLISLITIILDAGRSGFVYWLLSLGACYVFFLPYFSKKDKQSIRMFSMPVLISILIYIGIVTVSRFGETDDGSGNSLIMYAGQSFVYFCYFFDTFTCPIPSLQNVIPLTYYIMGLSIGNPEEIQQLISQTTGESLGVFYTFIGQIATSSHNIIAIIYCILFYMIFRLSFLNNRPKSFGVSRVLFYLFGASVMFLGLFGHYYAVWSRILAVILYLILFSIVKSGRIERNDSV